ncbi:MAG: hypothetical protein Q9M25_01505 [Mariprofundaceae bacterium]|nr:hypothetical protein [Mariprofundaceae bacterium]
MKFNTHVWAMLLALTLGTAPAMAMGKKAPTALYPVSNVLADKHADIVRPSVVNQFLVYSKRTSDAYSVLQADVSNPASILRKLEANHLNEALRFGVALNNGAIGYISNRMGPVSAWMRQARGDGHIAIGNLSAYSGALVPMNLHASYDGRVWCFDTTMEKVLQSRAITQFSDTAKHRELLAQTWRFYNSNNFQHKLGYKPTESGVLSKFENPSLFIFDRSSSQMTMIPNGVSGAVSPDGKRIAFVRNTGGNYDIFMQDIDGSDLVQITSSKYGDFEPAWSPDGQRIAFVSNRHSGGDLLGTSIYILDISSGRVQRLTNAKAATDGAPTWKNNHAIIFHSNRDPSDPQGDTVSRWSLWQVNFQSQ